MTNKIRLYGFSEKDRKVFSSLLSILRLKMEDAWIISDDWENDVIFIDIECDPQELKIKSLISHGKNVVVFGEKKKISHFSYHISRPLQATKILHCINYFKVGKNPAKNIETNTIQETRYKLKRWPSTSITENFSHSSRLCAVLMQHPVSIQTASKMVNMREADVQKFVDKCLANQYLKIVEGESPPNSIRKKRNSALFDKIRRKFGVNF